MLNKDLYTPCYKILLQLFFPDKDVDLMKSYISKIQQLESDLMRQNFSNACRHGLHDQLAMERDILLNDLGSECEVGTPDVSSEPPINFVKSLKQVPFFHPLDPF
jgi:hypothetical protein